MRDTIESVQPCAIDPWSLAHPLDLLSPRTPKAYSPYLSTPKRFALRSRVKFLLRSADIVAVSFVNNLFASFEGHEGMQAF